MPKLTQLALAAVAHRVLPPDAPAGPPEVAYFADQARDIPRTPTDFTRTVRRALEHPHPDDAPLAQLALHWNLSLAESLALALVSAVERDTLAGRALAYAQAPIGGSRPTLGLLAESFGHLDPNRRLNPVQLSHGPAFVGGALTLDPDGAPLPERAVSLNLPLCLALAGEETTWPGGTIGEPDAVPLPESVRDQCHQHALALGTSHAPILVLQATAPEETRATAAEIGRALGKRPYFIESSPLAGLSAWLHLRGLLPVFLLDPGPGEHKAVPLIPLYQGPILVATGPEGSITSHHRELTHWPIPRPNRTEREKLWRIALPHSPASVAELAASHRLTAARIAQLGKLAHHHARLHDGTAPDSHTLRAVSRSGEGSDLDSLAQRISESVDDDALVLSPDLRAELESLLSRCHHRDGLTQHLGAAAHARYTPGVRALFVGPSGTGKTLAACWLATRLGLPLFRVDLANITSKYIGETEKNLARLLARAERTEAVLLFDEADSLFGKRTDVRESNDRFANAQTNYLLQRIESFDSIALLTSNSRGRFDTAFSRRLDQIIEFPAPAPNERRALWQAHLGDHHRLSMQELNLLAGQCDFAGGQIRNAVLAAAVAAKNNGQVIDFPKIQHALAAEYRKAGRSLPPALALPKSPPTHTTRDLRP